MAESRNDNSRTAEVQNEAQSDGFQKWNGGEWEKVSLSRAQTPTPDPIAEDVNNNSLENGIPMKVMKMMGLPKSYRHSLYTDIVAEVQEITSLPLETASTFCSIINWLCGRNEVPPESSTKPDPDEHLRDATTSADSILTGPGSKIETPFRRSLTEFGELQKSEDNLCMRLPSLLTVTPSKCGMVARESLAAYSCEILEEGVQPPEQKSPSNEHIEGKHVTFAELENATVDNANGSGPLPQEETGVAVAEKEPDNDLNQNAVPAPQEDNANDSGQLPQEETGVTEKEPDNLVPPPGPQEEQTEPTPVSLPQSDLQEAPKEPEETSTAPLPSPSNIPPLPQLTPVKPEEKLEKTTSEIQLELQENLKTLEDIIKKLYKSLNKEGPLRIVANFIPTKQDGKFSVEIEGKNDNQGASGAVEKNANAMKKSPSTSTLDTEVDGSGTESSEYGPATVTITNVKRLVPETELAPEIKGPKKSVTISNDEVVFGMLGALNKKSSQPLYLQQPSSTLLGKRSMSFLGKMAVTGQSQSPPFQIPSEMFGSKVKLDSNNNFARASSSKLNKPPPILKPTMPPSKAAMSKPASLSDIPNSDFSAHSSGSEEAKRRPSTSTGNAYASSHNLSKYSPAPVPQRQRSSFKYPQSRSRSPHSNVQNIQHVERPRPTQPISRMERWDNSSPGNPHRIGNVRVVKACGRGAYEKITPFPQPQSHQHRHHFEQGDYVEESDASTEDSSLETTSMETGSEENTGTEVEMDPTERTLNYDFDYCQRPASSKSKAAISTVGLPPRTPPPTIIPSQDRNKFKATVYIPSGTGLASQQRSASYREMFDKRNQNQNQTLFIDLTSRNSGAGGGNKRDSEYVQLGQSSQSRYGRNN